MVQSFLEEANAWLLSMARRDLGFPVKDVLRLVMEQSTDGAIILFLVPLQVTVQLLRSATGFLRGTSGARERLILRLWWEAIIWGLRERRLILVLLRGQFVSKDVLFFLRKSGFNHKQYEITPSPRKPQRAGIRNGINWG